MPQIVARTCSDLHPVFVFMLADAENVAREEDSVFPMLQAMANAPIFSDRDGYFGNGIVGGPLISTEQRRHPVPVSAFCAARHRRYQNTNYRIFNTQIRLACAFRAGLASIGAQIQGDADPTVRYSQNVCRNSNVSGGHATETVAVVHWACGVPPRLPDSGKEKTISPCRRPGRPPRFRRR